MRTTSPTNLQPREARPPRTPGPWPRIILLIACLALSTGCREKHVPPSANRAESRSAQTLLAEARSELQQRFTEIKSPERERLLAGVATQYEQVLKDFADDSHACAQALRELGSIRALQGNTNEAVRLYTAVSERYPNREWEVLMAWKGAADLLWDGHRRDDARKFYARIVERFGGNSAQVVQAVVRGSKSRLSE